MNRINIISWLADRGRERSTWLGLVAALAVLGIHLTPEMQQSVTELGVALASFILIVAKDSSPSP